VSFDDQRSETKCSLTSSYISCCTCLFAPAVQAFALGSQGVIIYLPLQFKISFLGRYNVITHCTTIPIDGDSSNLLIISGAKLLLRQHKHQAFNGFHVKTMFLKQNIYCRQHPCQCFDGFRLKALILEQINQQTQN
jgi:hypothetical protein